MKLSNYIIAVCIVFWAYANSCYGMNTHAAKKSKSKVTPGSSATTKRNRGGGGHGSPSDINDSDDSYSDSSTYNGDKKKKAKKPNSNDSDDDEAAIELGKIVKGCRGSKEMITVTQDILCSDDDDSSTLVKTMKEALYNVIKFNQGELSKKELQLIMKKYDTDVAKVITDKGLVPNMGDDAIENAWGIGVLNYATLKEIERSWQNATRRGKQSTMDPSVSSCLKMVMQTKPRAYINAVREVLDLPYMKSDVVIENMLLIDLVCVPFDNEDKSASTYYKNVNKIAAKLGLSQSQLFAVTYIKVLFHAVHYKLEQLESGGAGGVTTVPLPLATFSSYTRKHWMGHCDDSNLQGVVQLIEDCCNMWHPEYIMRKGPRKHSCAEMEEKNCDINKFFSNSTEVLCALNDMPGVKVKLGVNVVDRNKLRGLVVEAIERMDTKMTKEEREAMYQLMLEACKKGGDESARLLWLAQAMEDIGWAVDLLEGTAKEEYDYFLEKKTYKGDFDKLKKNMISRLAAIEGCSLGGEASAVLLSLGGAIQDGKFESEEDEAIFDELLKNRYNNDRERLMQVIKNRFNGWKICRNVQLLRMEFDSVAHRMGWKGEVICDEVYKSLSTSHREMFDETVEIVMVGEEQPIGKDNLYSMLNGGYAFFLLCKRVRTIFVKAAKSSSSKMSGGKDGIFCNAVFNELDDDAKSVVKACAGMTLNSTNAEPLGLEGLFEKLSRMHFSQYNEEVLEKHVTRCKHFSTKYKNNDGQTWHIPNPCNAANASTYVYVFTIRDIEEGEYGYWKVKEFMDAGVDLRLFNQSKYQSDKFDKAITERISLNAEGAAMASDKKEVVIEEVTD